MKLVVVESPYAGNVTINTGYARACMADCLQRGEAPFASHLLYTQPGILRDEIPVERDRGIAAGWEWLRVAEVRAFYIDLGWSPGMLKAQELCQAEGLSFVIRSLWDQSDGE